MSGYHRPTVSQIVADGFHLVDETRDFMGTPCRLYHGPSCAVCGETTTAEIKRGASGYGGDPRGVAGSRVIVWVHSHEYDRERGLPSLPTCFECANDCDSYADSLAMARDLWDAAEGE